MIRLAATTEKLQAVLGGAVATTQPQAIVCYSDQTASGYSGGVQRTALNNTTDVDILAAPAASTIRDVDYIGIYNRDTASVTVTAKYDVSATDSIIIKVTLFTLETLEYTHGSGWKVVDANGSLKTSASGSPTGTAGGDLTGTYPNPTIANGAISLDELSDVAITSPATGATLIYDGANWIDGAVDEEGTFTPVLTFGGGSTGITYTAQVGNYTKIGNLVAVFVGLVLTSKGSSTGVVSVAGAPFTSKNTTQLRPNAFLRMNNMTAGTSGVAYGLILENTTSFIFQNYNSITGVTATLADTDYTNTTINQLSMSYFTA